MSNTPSTADTNASRWNLVVDSPAACRPRPGSRHLELELILIRSTDCTRTHRTRPHALPQRAFAVAAAILALAMAGLPSAARADGDPASDVLATQMLFLPQDAGVTLRQQEQLAALLRLAARHGYEIRVAMVASPVDLGSLTALWRRPQTYAHYLGQELSLLYRGPLLVVMPNGYGLYRAAGPVPTDQSALAGVRAPGADLGPATIAAIERTAAAAGHRLPLPIPTESANQSSPDTAAWLALALGAAVIALAWALSVRARPLRRQELAPPKP